jgi:hypothetical protein
VSLAKQVAEKSKQQIPRGLKPARDDKDKAVGRGAEAPHYPNKIANLKGALEQFVVSRLVVGFSLIA